MKKIIAKNIKDITRSNKKKLKRYWSTLYSPEYAEKLVAKSQNQIKQANKNEQI